MKALEEENTKIVPMPALDSALYYGPPNDTSSAVSFTPTMNLETTTTGAEFGTAALIAGSNGGIPTDDGSTTGAGDQLLDWNNANWKSFNFATGNQEFEVPLLLSVAIVGVIGNVSVLFVYLQKKFRKSNASMYIINLAIGELKFVT